MSCNYADGLSPYDDKGIVGLPEKFDSPEAVDEKCNLLAKWILESQHVVIHTGAGISTSAGIPDFRGPNGVWTLEKKGLKPNINVSFNEAIPTKTHMALTKLVETGYVKYIVSQNIDGLHLRSGLPRQAISELHGNMFTENCTSCKKQFIRKCATTSVGQKPLGTSCPGSQMSRRGCRGKLYDTVLDWEDSLPEDDLIMADYHSSYWPNLKFSLISSNDGATATPQMRMCYIGFALGPIVTEIPPNCTKNVLPYSEKYFPDLSICLGTTLQIVPSGNLPLLSKKYEGLLAIVNLQPTKHDKKANLLINAYIDVVIVKVMKYLGLEIPEYQEEIDPTKNQGDIPVEWSFLRVHVNEMKTLYNIHTKKFKRIKLEKKSKKEPSDDKIKECNESIKKEENIEKVEEVNKCEQISESQEQHLHEIIST